MLSITLNSSNTVSMPFRALLREGLGNIVLHMRMRKVKQICSHFKFGLIIAILKCRNVLPTLYNYIHIYISFYMTDGFQSPNQVSPTILYNPATKILNTNFQIGLETIFNHCNQFPDKGIQNSSASERFSRAKPQHLIERENKCKME